MTLLSWLSELPLWSACSTPTTRFGLLMNVQTVLFMRSSPKRFLKPLALSPPPLLVTNNFLCLLPLSLLQLGSRPMLFLRQRCGLFPRTFVRAPRLTMNLLRLQPSALSLLRATISKRLTAWPTLQLHSSNNTNLKPPTPPPVAKGVTWLLGRPRDWSQGESLLLTPCDGP